MDLLMWHIRKNCSLFITSGTLSQLTGNTSICNTSKIDFRRLEALFCGVWPSPDFSLLSSRISLQNRKKCRFEPTFKKACPARPSGRKSLISSGFRRVRGLQKRPQNGHPRHSRIKDSKSCFHFGSPNCRKASNHAGLRASSNCELGSVLSCCSSQFPRLEFCGKMAIMRAAI